MLHFLKMIELHLCMPYFKQTGHLFFIIIILKGQCPKTSSSAEGFIFEVEALFIYLFFNKRFYQIHSKISMALCTFRKYISIKHGDV